MRYRCHGCVFKSEWKEDGEYVPLCIRDPNADYEESKLECTKPGVCPHRTSYKEAELYMEANE